ncbi:hypothetical protein D9M68_94170 [compost metagenome]
MSLRDEYEKPTHGYLDIGSAVCFLAGLERVPQHHTAKWLLARRAHETLRTYDTEKCNSDPYAFGLAELSPNELNEQVNTRRILEAVMQHDYLWVDHANTELLEVDSRLRWDRDEFWRFVVDNGVAVEPDSFEDERDAPTFLRRDNAPALSPHRGPHGSPLRELQAVQRELAALTRALQEVSAKVSRLHEQLQSTAFADEAEECDESCDGSDERSRERRRWSDEELAELLQLHRSGMTMAEIGRKHGVTGQRISFLLSQARTQESAKAPPISNIWPLRNR